MFQSILKLIFGSKNERFVKEAHRTIERINDHESHLSALSNEDLSKKTIQFKERLAQGETLEDLLPEAFAVVREASVRILGLRHYDVQMVGGIALHQGKIAEMATGEGKTLVATLPAYLNALKGQGVHVVTVNDYLAERDCAQMGKIYHFLGLTTGVITSKTPQNQRKAAYDSDITYGSNNELGFDYLRDNMATKNEHFVQREHVFAIVDEVDSILIDEARTPLIISGPTGQSSELYKSMYPLIKDLSDDGQTPDVIINLKEREVSLTENGLDRIELKLKQAGHLTEKDDLYSGQHAMLLHFVEACLQARFINKKDIHYLVNKKSVTIIDEHTGRSLPGRRWSRGIHQAIEAKENVPIQQENQTLASITFQNYFRLYHKLSGMTGTADTEAEELEQIYHLEVIVIPTHKPCIRREFDDIIFMTKEAKYRAICKDIIEKNKNMQPVLVGTTSVEDSEHLSMLLRGHGVMHKVLNAKQHAKEADIIAEAGEPGKVTIATNMAGRGTDIILGGKWDRKLNKYEKEDADKVASSQQAWLEKHEQVIACGGLHVIATERHESRRVDNQLKGRCARQGDPGSSQFYLSLEDHLFRIFPQSVLNFIKKSSQDANESLQAPMLNRAISSNQQKMEGFYYDRRKQILKYDDIANGQRQVLYRQRQELLNMNSIHDRIEDTFKTHIHDTLNDLIQSEQLNPKDITSWAKEHIKMDVAFSEDEGIASYAKKLAQKCYSFYSENTSDLEKQDKNNLEKNLLLQIIDHHWKEHLFFMEDLREHVGLRGVAQKNPEHEYKIEAHRMFESMLKKIKSDFTTHLLRVRVESSTEKKPNTPETTPSGVAMVTPFD